jgi:ribonuclease HII
MMEAVRTSETSVDNHFTRQYNLEDSSEHHTRRRENLKSHIENTLASFSVGFLSSSEISMVKGFTIQEKSFHLCWGLNFDRLVIQPMARH